MNIVVDTSVIVAVLLNEPVKASLVEVTVNATLVCSNVFALGNRQRLLRNVQAEASFT
jgi:hypothetical protein